jgi:hypothetical protein
MRIFGLAALLALCCTGCAHLPAQPVPALVDLALAIPGVTDARQPFSQLFQIALHEQDTHNDDPGTWLHTMRSTSDPDATRLLAIRARFARRAGTASVLLVPGLFSDCVESQAVPFGDGVPRMRERSALDSYRQYDDLGLASIRLLSLPGRSSSVDNGHRLAQAIRSEAERPQVERILMVAFSKGVPDSLRALAELQTGGGVPGKLTALVSVAGVVMGTPIADRYEKLYGNLSPTAAFIDCAESDGQELASLPTQASKAWLSANPLPGSLQYYSIVAHVAPSETAVLLRPFRGMLDAIDPRNDGRVIAADAILPASTLLAEVRADHWEIALPRDRHPGAVLRALTSGRAYPREALFRALMWWVVGDGD